MLERVYTGQKTIEPPATNNQVYLNFFKPWRAFHCAYTTVDYDYSIKKLFHDGTCLAMSNDVSIGYLNRLADGGLGVYVNAWVSNPVRRRNKLFTLDEFTGAANYMDGHYAPDNGQFGTQSLVDRKNDILIRPYYPSAVRAWRLSTGAVLWTFYHNWGGGTSSVSHKIGWVRDGVAVLFAGATGYVTFFNYLTQTVLLKTAVDTGWQSSHSIAYDCVNHVIVVVGSDLKTRVYVPVAVPDHLTTPVVSPASPEQYGHAHLSTRLVGSFNESCADWWIHWRLLNGKGFLKDVVTQTDQDGYAYNYYTSPTLDEQLGSEDVIVEVVT